MFPAGRRLRAPGLVYKAVPFRRQRATELLLHIFNEHPRQAPGQFSGNHFEYHCGQIIRTELCAKPEVNELRGESGAS